MHRNTLNISAKTAPEHLAISLAAVKVYARYHSLPTALGGERFAAVQEMFELYPPRPARAGRRQT